MSRPFRFKRFTVMQERAAMKVGTDGVLLGAWCTVRYDIRRALDIGTGTGVIALILAQRGEGYGLIVDALEPEAGAWRDASANAAASPWSGRISVFDKSVQEFVEHPQSGTYDLIACNPPYFSSSLLPPESKRASARHNLSLDSEELIASASSLAHHGTLFSFIIPSDQAGEYIVSCDLRGFTLTRRTDVRTTPSAPAKRTLLEFVYGPSGEDPIVDELVIELGPLDYTEQYRSLTGDFYLRF